MPWIQFIIESDAAAAPALVDWLDTVGAAAVTLRDSADQPLYEPPPGEQPLWNRTRVVGLFPAESDSTALAAALSAHTAPAPPPPHRFEALEDKDWSRTWMEDFKPMRFGRRLWIVPSWHTPPEPDAVNILLDPGLAFGTGTHPTTRLCLEWLDGLELIGQRVIDYGAGSGILAIAAARLGARQVIAVDNDPQALIAARENAARNGVADRVTAVLPEDLEESEAEVVVANILAGPLVALAPRLTRLAAPGGQLALSGILAEQAAEVAAAYRREFTLDAPVELEGWVRLAGIRSSGAND